MQPALNAMAERALYDEKVISSIFPNVPVTLISGTRTGWMCVWAYHEANRIYNEHLKNGRGIRPMQFLRIRGANHFVRDCFCRT